MLKIQLIINNKSLICPMELKDRLGLRLILMKIKIKLLKKIELMNLAKEHWLKRESML